MLVGILATALIVAATPDDIQSFYWLTGSLTYTVPCIVGTFAAALIVRLARRLALNQGIHPLHLVGLFALCLTAGLFNEPYTLVQGALVGCGLLFTLLYAREQRGWWLTLITAALASLTALIILVIAPGNSVRQTFFVAAPSPLTALVQSVQYALIFTASAINFNPPGVIMAILVGIAIPGVVQHKSIQRGDTHASQWTRRKYLMLMVLYITAWLLVCTAFMFPGLYATQMPPPGRSFAIIMWVYMPWWVGLGALLRLSLWGNARLNAGVERWNMRLVRLAVVVHAVWAVNEAILPVTYSLSYGAEWDARAATLTTATATDDIIVVPLPHELATIRGLDTIGADSSFWVNICAARYYGVRALRTSDGEI